jgi:hypothetical protein
MLVSLSAQAEGLVGRWVSLRSTNYRENLVRHQNFLGELTPIASDLDRKDASFKVVPGLAGQGVSFESIDYPGQFLRHQNSRVKLAGTLDPAVTSENNQTVTTPDAPMSFVQFDLAHATFDMHLLPTSPIAGSGAGAY